MIARNIQKITLVLLAALVMLSIANCQEEASYQTLEFLESENYEEVGFLGRRHKPNVDTTVAITDYDMYVFSLGWSSSYCLTIKETAACYDKLAKLQHPYILRIHGLWPSLLNGKMLPQCHSGKDIYIDYKDEEPFTTMLEYWPSLNKNHFTDFWTHEYNKHGYCYSQKYNQGEDYISFFEKTLSLYFDAKYDSLMDSAFGGQEGDEIETTYDDIVSKFAKVLGVQNVELQCGRIKGKQLVTEVRFYYDLDFKPLEIKYHTNCDSSKNIVIPFTMSK